MCTYSNFYLKKDESFSVNMGVGKVAVLSYPEVVEWGLSEVRQKVVMQMWLCMAHNIHGNLR